MGGLPVNETTTVSKSGAAQQGDEADEAFGGTNPRAASGAQPEVPPNARAGQNGRGHRFAAYPRCSTDVRRVRALDSGERDDRMPVQLRW